MTKRDLFVVVADLDAENAINALLCYRQQALGIQLDFNPARPPQREAELEERLTASGWRHGDVAVVVIEPELEAWVWANSTHVADTLGWNNERQDLRRFLHECQLWDENAVKPNDPKAAVSEALRKKRKPRGARLFSDLARRVALSHCQDPAFQKLRQTLAKWFLPDNPYTTQ